MSIKKKILKNNIVLVTEPIATSKTVAIGFWFSVGSRYEKDFQSGITHFVEHMIFKGTPKRTAYEIACSFDRIGGYVNAFTERELVCLHCVVPAQYAEFALEILADMSHNALFLEQDVNKERSVIESEIISAQDDPEEACLDTVIDCVFPENPLSKNICGTLDTVKNLSPTDLKNWYTEYFKEGELLITVAGNFDESKILAEIEEYPARKEAKVFHQFENFPKWNKGFHYRTSDFQQEQVLLLFPVKTPAEKKEYFSFAILNALIGDTMSSRLFQSLRENRGFCYNVYSFFNFYADCGFWGSYASCNKKDIVDLCQALKNEIQLLLDQGISEEELQAAKEHLCGEEIINSEDVENRMKRLFRLYSFNFEMETNDETVAQIRAITKNDILEVLPKLLNLEEKALVFYGPKINKSLKQEIENVFRK